MCGKRCLLQVNLTTIDQHYCMNNEACFKEIYVLVSVHRPTELSGQVETALNELNVAMILRRRGHVRSLRYIKDHRHSLDTAKPLFLDLATDTATRLASKVLTLQMPWIAIDTL